MPRYALGEKVTVPFLEIRQWLGEGGEGKSRAAVSRVKGRGFCQDPLEEHSRTQAAPRRSEVYTEEKKRVSKKR